MGFLAKDPWDPAIRREQMIARQLVQRGLPVRFVQAPADARRLRTDPGNWWAHLRRARFQSPETGIAVTERSTVQPGLRSPAAERLDAGLLAGFLHRSGWDPELSVFMLPWEWRAASALPGRRVFDCTDDWARLLPHARGLPDQLRRIADEADEVVVVNPVLADLFPGRTPVVVPNGTDETLLTAPRTAERRERHAVYVGSIAERFDVDLVRALLAALPDWTLTVHGQLVFPSSAQAARERFLALERETGGRFRYEGLLPRARLADVLDAATVGLIPDVAGIALGQSSMKTYDYCARGLPVVATAGHLEHSGETPPHTSVVATAQEMAAAMRAAVDEPVGCAKERVDWAAERTWDRRTDAWLDATLGRRPARVTGVHTTTAPS
ncbi:glycosyltransferase family 1 protein [Modestobacter altitudinis]|uniref:glycosyltransferase family 1 protein n=1 Tax=Modestobacter altitudinis TaxID=2213158 RepID=UPI00110D02FC|nr:glycosyltransferase family 1 protein [Modestobacter altitudinis]